MYIIANLAFHVHIMKTELISLQDYRKNISTLRKKANQENIKYIVMVHSNPVLEIIPIRKREMRVAVLTPTEKKRLDKALEEMKDEKNFISFDDRKQKNAKKLWIKAKQKSGKISKTSPGSNK